MKKIYLALMCMASFALMTACSGGEKKSTEAAEGEADTEAVAEEAVQESDENPGVAKCAATLENGWGIKLKQIEPDFAYEKVTEGWDKFEGNGVNSAAAVYKKQDGSNITSEEFQAWAGKLFALTQSLAEDGKNIRGYDGISHLTEEQANAVVTLEECLKDNSFPAWSFRTGKGIQRCYITFVEPQSDKKSNYIVVRFAPGLTGNID